MAVDPTISLQAQAPQIDFAAIYATAQQLRQMRDQAQFQNTLKTILTTPDAVDDKTGQPTPNTLAKIARLGPQGLEFSTKVSDQQAQARQRDAETRHATAQATQEETEGAHEALRSGLDVYDAELGSGGVAPQVAEDNLKSSLHDWVMSQPWDQDRKDRNWQVLSGMNPTQLRAAATKLSVTQAERQRQAELTEERQPATMNGKPVLVDKEGNVYDANGGAKVEVTAPVIKQEPGFNPQAADARVSERPPIQYQDANGKLILGHQHPDGSVTWTASDGVTSVPAPESVTRVPGTPRSAIGAAVQAYQETPGYKALPPDARPQALAQFNASYHQTEMGGTAGVKADAQSLANITKINDSATAYENTALANFKTAEGLAAKGVPTNMGPWLNKWISDGEVALGDPNIPPYAAALLTGANEYAKVMSGSTGSQGSTVDSRKEAAEIFSKYLNTGQIGPVIDIAARDMENKKASYAGQIHAIRDRIDVDAPGSVPVNAAPPAAPAPAAHEKTATGPGGRKIVLRGGRWVDMKTGEPVQ